MLPVSPAYRPPFDWGSLLGFLEECGVPGVELVRGGQYRRTISVDDQVGVINLSRPHVSRQQSRDEVVLEVRLPEPRALLLIVERVRRMLDLAADPVVLEEHLSGDPLLGRRMKDNPGV